MPSTDSTPPAVPDRDKRAADADRQRVAERLRTALDEGRLELGEYDERLQRTYAAKTYAELDPLLADIPSAAPAAASRLEPAGEKSPHEQRHDQLRAEHDRRRRERRCGKRDRSIKQAWAGVGGAAIFFTGIWVMQWIAGGGEPPYYWPVWVFGFWALGAACATWAKLMKD